MIAIKKNEYDVEVLYNDISYRQLGHLEITPSGRIFFLSYLDKISVLDSEDLREIADILDSRFANKE